MKNLIVNTTTNYNGLGLIQLKQLLKSVSTDNFYILFSFLAFTTVLLFTIYIERKLEVRRKEKISQRKQFLKNIMESHKHQEISKTAEKKLVFDDIDMLEHVI